MTTATIKLPAELAADIDLFEGEVRRFLAGELAPGIFKARRVPRGIYEQRRDGTYMVRVRIPGPAFTNNFDLELDAPPDGISIENISAAGMQAEILLRSDAAKIKPGAKGNLIVNIINKRPQQAARAGAPARGNQKPPVLGTLPAIPFAIVGNN